MILTLQQFEECERVEKATNSNLTLEQLENKLNAYNKEYKEIHAVIYPNNIYNDEQYNIAKQNGKLQRYNLLQVFLSDIQKIARNKIRVDHINNEIENATKITKKLFVDTLAKALTVEVNNEIKEVEKANNHAIVTRSIDTLENSFLYFASGYKFYKKDNVLMVVTTYNDIVKYKI